MDGEFVDKIGKKDFNDVVAENTDFVVSIIKKFVKDSETVKDLTQEIFLKAYLNYEKYSERGKIRAWLAVITNNMLKNHYKAESYISNQIIFSPIEEISDQLLSYANIPENIVAEKDFMDGIIKIINSLSENQRDAIIYSFFYNYSEKEIASMKNISLSAVKSAKYFGLKKVKELVNYELNGVRASNKNNPSKKFGRYRMVKCYAYVEGKLTEYTELHRESVIELISPSQSEIADVARFLNIDESDISALIAGDFDNIKCNHILATRFNTIANVIIGNNLEYMIVCRDKAEISAKENSICAELINALCGMAFGYVNLDAEDLSTLFRGTKTALLNSSFALGEKKVDAALDALSPEVLDVLNRSKSILITGTFSNDVTLDHTNEMMNKVMNALPQDCSMMYALNFDGELNDEIHATVIAIDKAS